MAFTTIHTIVVHFGSTVIRTKRIDPEEYGFFDLIADVNDCIFTDTDRNPVAITIRGKHPGSNDSTQITKDAELVELFYMHKDIEEMHFYVTLEDLQPLAFYDPKAQGNNGVGSQASNSGGTRGNVSGMAVGVEGNATGGPSSSGGIRGNTCSMGAGVEANATGKVFGSGEVRDSGGTRGNVSSMGAGIEGNATGGPSSSGGIRGNTSSMGAGVEANATGKVFGSGEVRDSGGTRGNVSSMAAGIKGNATGGPSSSGGITGNTSSMGAGVKANATGRVFGSGEVRANVRVTSTSANASVRSNVSARVTGNSANTGVSGTKGNVSGMAAGVEGNVTGGASSSGGIRGNASGLAAGVEANATGRASSSGEVRANVRVTGTSVNAGVRSNVSARVGIIVDSSDEDDVTDEEAELTDYDDDDWGNNVDKSKESRRDNNSEFDEVHEEVGAEEVGADEMSDYMDGNENGVIESDESDEEAIAIDRAMRGRPFTEDANGKVVLEVGMLFNDVDHLREVVKEYMIQEGVEIYRKKNDKRRYTIECLDKNCAWHLHASVLADKRTFKIKEYEGEHSCIRTCHNSAASPSWIAKKLAGQLGADPCMNYNLMRQELRASYGVEVPTMRLWRARNKAKEEISGSYVESYNKLPHYAELVVESNPGSIVRIQYESLDMTVNPTFKRFFLSFEAMKKGFTDGCRPFLGLDGCHLKGPFGGILLAAVALDGNNGLFPVAVAVVENENTESWSWFLYHLSQVVHSTEKPITLMTDGQKGLAEAIRDIMPQARQRRCCRHIYSNFKLLYPGLEFKTLFWLAAKAYNHFVFKKAMEKLKSIEESAYQWLMERPVELWARHAFDTSSKSDHVTNNMAESFNNWIRDERDKPILSLLEGIRVKIMGRMYHRYEGGNDWDRLVTPNIRKKVNVIKLDGRCCKVEPAGSYEFNVVEGVTTFVVNVLRSKWSCPCRYWEITGIPCKHAAACITYKRYNIESFCDPYYHSFAYNKAYGNILHPVPDLKLVEPKEQYKHVEPPFLRRMSGRPKRNRRREPGEAPAIGRSTTVRCSTCNALGHNKRGCQIAPVGSNKRFKGGKKGKGKKDKHVATGSSATGDGRREDMHGEMAT